MDNKRNFDYKWVIVGLSFLMVMISLGFCSSTKSLYIAPVTSALNIKRGAFALNDSFRFVTTAVVNVFFGFLVSKYRIKRLILIGFASLIASQIIYSVATNVFAFYIGGILLGLGFAFTTTTMVGCIVNRWCKESKGKIMGAILASNGIGGAIAIQTITPIIASDDFGYRLAYRLTAIVLLVVCVLVLLFFKEKPTDSSETTVTKKTSRGKDWIGVDYNDAVKMPYFYAAVVCIFLTGFVLQGVNGVAAAHMKDVGIDPTYVGMVLSIHSLVLALAKFFTGYVYDKFGLKTAINFCSATAVTVMLLLTLITNSHAGRAFAMAYGVLSAFALPLETIMLPIYAGDLFGQKSFDKMLGIFASANVCGYALSAPAINAVYDVFGSYRAGFVSCSAIMLGTVIILQFVIKAAYNQRKLAEKDACLAENI